MKTQEQINAENLAAEKNPFYNRTFVTFKDEGMYNLKGERARIYSIYNETELSLCIKGYTDAESGCMYLTEEFILPKKGKQ